MSIEKKTKYPLILFFNLAGIFLFFLLLGIANHYEGLEAEEFTFLTFEFSKTILVDILVHVAAATIMGIIVTNFLKRFNERDLTQKLDELKTEMEKIFPKVQHVPVDIGLEQAIHHLENMDNRHEHIYTVGIGKSELYDSSTVIQGYYDKTEEILKSRPAVVYKRITTNKTAQKNFLTHLTNLLGINKSDKDARVFLLVSENDHLVADAFLIVGKKFLFISPTALTGSGKKKIIGSNCLVTEDKDIIEQYTEHFEDMWNKYHDNSKIITSVDIFKANF